MVTKEEKDRILLEETLRHEIREQLGGSGRKGGFTLWTFMNSTFFLWFLSSVLIGSISFLYARTQKQKDDENRIYQQRQQAERERSLSEKKLDAEISSRLSYFGITYESDSFKALIILDKPAEANYPVIVFPEYSNRSLQSLLWELLQVVPDESKKEVNEAYNKSKQFAKYYSFGPKVNSLSTAPFNSKEMWAEMARKASVELGRLAPLNLERWGKPLKPIVGDATRDPFKPYELPQATPATPTRR